VPKSRKKNDLDLLLCGSLGLELTVALGLGALLGRYLDSWLSTTPILLVLGCMLGLLAGMFRIVRTVSGLQARGPRQEPSDEQRPGQRPDRAADHHADQP